MMVFSEGFDAVVEALYSKAELTPYLSQADVVVNPIIDKYYGKNIIISMPIDSKIIRNLLESNKVVSRIPLDFPEGSYIYQPYEDRELNLKPLEKVGITADKQYFKQIKYLVINSVVYAEVPELILDQEYKGDKTFLGLINTYLKV